MCMINKLAVFKHFVKLEIICFRKQRLWDIRYVLWIKNIFVKCSGVIMDMNHLPSSCDFFNS